MDCSPKKRHFFSRNIPLHSQLISCDSVGAVALSWVPLGPRAQMVSRLGIGLISCDSVGAAASSASNSGVRSQGCGWSLGVVVGDDLLAFRCLVPRLLAVVAHLFGRARSGLLIPRESLG